MESTHVPQGPRVSVIMACRNGLPYLGEALDSLNAQSYGHWELLFVDSGSTDGSAQVVEASIPQARILAAPDAPPLGVARDRAVERAEGTLLAFLDADDRWRPEKLERQVALLTGSGADLVYSDCTVVDEAGEPLGLYLSRHRPARGDVFEALLAGNFVPLPTILVTRDLYERSGGFSTRPLSEDYRWLLEAALHGVFDYEDAPLADYRLTPGSLTEDFRASYRENVRIFEDLAGAEGDAARKRLYEVAGCKVLWRWAIREAMAGPRDWPAAAELAKRALSTVRTEGGVSHLPASIWAFVQVLRDGLRGVGLRRRMLAARKPTP